MLIVYAVGGAIAIVHDDRDGGNEDGRDAMRPAAKSGGYCAAKSPPSIVTFVLKVLQHPLRPAVPVCFKRIDHTPFIQRKRQPWSIEEAQKRAGCMIYHAKLNNKHV